MAYQVSSEAQGMEHSCQHPVLAGQPMRKESLCLEGFSEQHRSSRRLHSKPLQQLLTALLTSHLCQHCAGG